jgi:signal transduction histidine kinase
VRDTLAIIAIASGCSVAVGVVGLIVIRLLRQRSVRQAFVAVAIITVLAFVAGLLGTAQAMFLSNHDFYVTTVVIVSAGLVSLGIALMLAGQVVRGSQALAAGARTLGDDGHYVPPPAPATAELAALSKELEEASRKLAEARERERALETSRRELVAWVSHDLRSPLAGLRAMAEALEDGVAPDPGRFHRQIRVEVDRLARMVDDLFELSRIHAGALQLTLEEVSLSDLVSDALAAASPLAEAKGVLLSGHASAVPHGVRADAGELVRALSNLVGNAIRHTPSSGSVVVEAGTRDGQAILAVTDACGGIPDADLPRVFDVAWRGTDARTPGTDTGAGLGLAIVRGVAEAHHGSVSVRNVGAGCRFELAIPVTAGHPG